MTTELYLSFHDAFVNNFHGELRARVRHSAFMHDREISIADFLHDLVP